MVIAWILTFVFGVFNAIVNMIPDIVFSSDTFDISSLTFLLSKAFIIFPLDLFKLCTANIAGWMGVQMAWAIIEWIYKKIPGVN